MSYIARNTMSALSIMGERIDRLNRVARDGDIDAFYSLIREDVKILEDIDALPFVDTPLHIIASAEPGGPVRIKFAMEMMRLKPSFARKPNPNGYSPIQLALQKGHTQMVRQLLQADRDLVRVKGKEGRTPLHDVAATAATKQQLDLLDKFLSDCPNSIEDATIQNQTALHIALENNNLDAFIRFVVWLRKNKFESGRVPREILNRPDEEGNTVLHRAVSKNQTKFVRHLLDWDGIFIDVNIKNLEGKTAWDILQEQRVDNKKIRDLLHRAGALPGLSLPTVTCCASQPEQLKCKFYRKFQIEPPLELKNVSDERRSAVLVVVALLVTVTYQAVLSPPGGIWPDDQSNDIAPHTAGTAIGTRGWPFWLFLFCNSVTFVFSNATIILLVPIWKFRWVFWALTIFLWVCYFNSLIVITDAPVWTFYIVVSVMPIHIVITGYPVSAMHKIKRLWNHIYFCWYTKSKLNCIMKRNEGEKSQA